MLKRRKSFLIVSDSNDVTNVGLGAITSLPKLQYLEVRGLKMITDDVFNSVSDLRTLKCTSCYNLKNAGLNLLIARTKNLELLEIRNCQQINRNDLIRDATLATRSRTNDVALTICVEKRFTVCKMYKVSTYLHIIEEVIKKYHDPVNIFASY